MYYRISPQFNSIFEIVIFTNQGLQRKKTNGNSCLEKSHNIQDVKLSKYNNLFKHHIVYTLP